MNTREVVAKALEGTHIGRAMSLELADTALAALRVHAESIMDELVEAGSWAETMEDGRVGAKVARAVLVPALAVLLSPDTDEDQ